MRTLAQRHAEASPRRGQTLERQRRLQLTALEEAVEGLILVSPLPDADQNVVDELDAVPDPDPDLSDILDQL